MNPRIILLALASFAVGAGVFTLPSPPVLADESAVSARADRFVHFDLPDRDVIIDPSVSREVQSRATITKVSFGKISTVEIFTTATGTYSSDALQSSHIRYPGITVADRASRNEGTGGTVSIWRNGIGWVTLPLSGAGSFAVVTHPGPGSALITTGDGNCYVSRRGAFC